MFYLPKVAVRKRWAVRLQLQAENFVCGKDYTARFYLPKVTVRKVGCQTTAPGRDRCDRDHTVRFYLPTLTVRKVGCQTTVPGRELCLW